MASFFDRMLGRNKQGSGAVAKDRLRFVLQYDRINIPPEKMEEMKREILAVISKYVAVDDEKVDIALEQRDRQHSKIVADIPFTKGETSYSSSSTSDGDEEQDDSGTDDDQNHQHDDDETDTDEHNEDDNEPDED